MAPRSRSVGLLQHDVGRDEVVLLIDRNAMARIVDHGGLGVRQYRRKFGDLRSHLGNVEVVTVDHLKPQASEGVCNGLRVERRIVERRSVL